MLTTTKDRQPIRLPVDV